MPKLSKDKFVLYQILTRLMGNANTHNAFNGSIESNGVGKMNDIQAKTLKSIKQLGVSHVWYTGIIEHATMTDYSAYGIKKDHPLVIKGRAGSPYAIKDYYDIDPDLAEEVPQRVREFEELVKRTHKEGLKVIIDFIPNHVARQYKSDAKPSSIEDFGENDDMNTAFASNNNFYYLPHRQFITPQGLQQVVKHDEPYIEFPAKATGNDVFSERPHINDWFETIKLNYGIDYQNGRSTHFYPIPDTWHKMRDILIYWASKGVDGFRCDMAEMVPVEFWKWLTTELKKNYPGLIFIAEIYNPQQYRNYIFEGGFDYLYDKVGLYDALRRLIEGHGNANDITSVWQNESGDFSEKMLRFLENHDEQRIASNQFAGNGFRAIPAMALSAFLHKGPIMLYFGQELGVKPTKAEGFQSDDGRTTLFDYWGIEEIAAWNNKGKWNTAKLTTEQKNLRKQYAHIMKTALSHEAIHSGDFYDLQYVNKDGQSMNYIDSKIYSFLRYTEKEQLLFIFNFDQQVSQEFEFEIPEHAFECMKIKTKSVIFSSGEEKVKFTLGNKVTLSLKPNSWKMFSIG